MDDQCQMHIISVKGAHLPERCLESTAFDSAIGCSLLPHRMQFFFKLMNLDSIIKVDGLKTRLKRKDLNP